MNVLLLAPELEVSEGWYRAITGAVPGTRIMGDGELADTSIMAPIVACPKSGRLCKIPNLKLILSLSAGIDVLSGRSDITRRPNR